MVARGDRNAEIARKIGVNPLTVARIKKRHPDVLKNIQGLMIERQVSQASKLLEKSHKLLEDDLDTIEAHRKTKKQITGRFRKGEINAEEYRSQLEGLVDASIAELTSLSREMFTESRVEQGQPTSISQNPKEAQAELKKLVELIEAGDTVELQKIIFNPTEEPKVAEDLKTDNKK